jgi:hypothetical protein
LPLQCDHALSTRPTVGIDAIASSDFHVQATWSAINSPNWLRMMS